MTQRPHIMSPEEIREEFERDACVVRDGHFVYAGGKHGSVYVRKDILLSDTRRARKLVIELGRRILSNDLDHGVGAVVGPAQSGIIMAHRVADYLDDMPDWSDEERRVRAYYAEKERRESDGQEIFVLRRDFPMAIKGLRVLVAEDVVNEGSTSRRVVEAVMLAGGTVVGVVALWNRGPHRKIVLPMPGSPRAVEIPIVALVEEELEAWRPADCPLCAKGVPISITLGHGAAFLSTRA